MEDTNWCGTLAPLLGYLLLGSAEDAADLKRLRRLGVTHVLNAAEGDVVSGPEFYGTGVVYLGIPAEDDEDYDMIRHLPLALEFLEQARQQGGLALLHCNCGINRAGFLAIAAAATAPCGISTGSLMPGEKLLAAAKLVKLRRRGLLLTNPGFRKQLVDWWFAAWPGEAKEKYDGVSAFKRSTL